MTMPVKEADKVTAELSGAASAGDRAGTARNGHSQMQRLREWNGLSSFHLPGDGSATRGTVWKGASKKSAPYRPCPKIPIFWFVIVVLMGSSPKIDTLADLGEAVRTPSTGRF